MNPALVLGIDTSTVVAAGLAGDGIALAAAVVPDSRAHVESLMPLVQRCLADAGRSIGELTTVVVGLGPGPFTGLRVGVVTAAVLAEAMSAPLHGICSLDVLATQHVRGPAQSTGDFLVATDARRKEVYWARYAETGRRLEGPYVGAPDTLPRLPVVGPAADLYPDRLAAVPGPRELDPGVLAAVGLTLPSAGSEPLYLRRADAAEPTRHKSVLLQRPSRIAR